MKVVRKINKIIADEKCGSPLFSKGNLAFLIYLSIFPTLLISETSGKGENPLQVIELCEKAIENGTNPDEHASKLLKMDNLILAPETRFRGMACLKANYNENFFYSLEEKRFVRSSDVSRNLKLQREYEEQRRQKKVAFQVEYTRRLQSACYQRLSENPLEALTNDWCKAIFERLGFESD